MCGSLSRGNREISLPAIGADGPVGEGQGRNPDMYGNEKSDRVIVPKKETNNENQQRTKPAKAELCTRAAIPKGRPRKPSA